MFYEGLLDEFVETPEGFNITIPTTARAVVDEAVDSVTPADLLIAYSPRSATGKGEEDADAVRRYVKNLWTYWRTNAGDIDVLRDFLKNLFRSGKACFKMAPDHTLWPSIPDDVIDEKKSQGAAGRRELSDMAKRIKDVRDENVPFYCRSIPPQCIMEDPAVGGRKLWLIERYRYSPEEVRQQYSWLIPELRVPQQGISYDIHELWTAEWVDWAGKYREAKHYVFVNWDCILEEKNPYGFLPYVVKYSGFGREAFEGRPEYKSVGFYTRQNKSMFLAEARRVTHFDAIFSQLAFPIAFLDEKVELSNISFTPGAVNYVPTDILANLNHVWLTAPIPAPEYLQSLNYIGNQIERGTVSRSLRGAPLPGADSAAQYGQQAGNAKQRVQSCQMATEQAMAVISGMALKYIEKHLKAPTSVFVAEDNHVERYTLAPAQIKGRYTVGVSFQPNEDAVKERKLVLANDAVTKGNLSPYDAYVFAGFDNPLELIARRQAYDIMNTPVIKDAMAHEELKRWGIDADQIEIERRMEEATKQQKLRAFTDQLQLGSVRGDGTDPNQQQAQGGQPQDPNQQGGQQPPQTGANQPQQPGPPGAPPQVVQQNAPVQGMMRDVNAAQGGPQ